jgi:hypothetical protein
MRHTKVNDVTGFSKFNPPLEEFLRYALLGQLPFVAAIWGLAEEFFLFPSPPFLLKLSLYKRSKNYIWRCIFLFYL